MADEKDNGPSAAVIGQLKQQFSDRSLHLVEMDSKSGEKFAFVLTAPTRAEWKLYRSNLNDDGEDEDKLEEAIEKMALAQTKWPTPDIVRGIFERQSGIIAKFARELKILNGGEVETRSRKL